MTTSLESESLTLADDEKLFSDGVYEFADREVRPYVREMDEHAKLRQALLPKLFDLADHRHTAVGLMGRLKS
jgi:hypothetical protein